MTEFGVSHTTPKAKVDSETFSGIVAVGTILVPVLFTLALYVINEPKDENDFLYFVPIAIIFAEFEHFLWLLGCALLAAGFSNRQTKYSIFNSQFLGMGCSGSCAIVGFVPLTTLFCALVALVL